VREERPLGVWTAVFLGVNAIVGSGIYLFPGPLADRFGPLSLVVFATTALVCAPIALAYAELARDHDRSGGTYRYVAAELGPFAGALLGWVSWISAVVSWSAVANAIPRYLGEFVRALAPGRGGKIATATLVVGLTAVNFRGVRMGAWVSNSLTIGKVLPLLFLSVAGLAAWVAHPAALHPFAPHGAVGLGGAIFHVLFAYQGFEVVGVPAGEMKDARHAVPRGVLGSLAFSAVLYCAVQLAYLAAGAPGGDAPLARAASVIGGSAGATLLGLGGLVSIAGFNAGSAVGSPRYLSALAEDGHLPAALAARHARFGTPAHAILWTGIATFVCALFLDFERLVDIANVSVTVQYAAVSVALLVARRTLKWWTIAVGAIGLCVWLLWQAPRRDLAGFAISVVVGAIALAIVRARKRR
jgi:amino acid transporter